MNNLMKGKKGLKGGIKGHKFVAKGGSLSTQKVAKAKPQKVKKA